MNISAGIREQSRIRLVPAAAAAAAGGVGAWLASTSTDLTVVAGMAAAAVLVLLALIVGSTVRAMVVLAAIANVAALLWVYSSLIAPTYAYQGLIDASPEPGSVLLAAVTAVLPAVWLPIAADRPSIVVLWVLYVMGYVPATLMPLLVGGRPPASILPLNAAVLASMGIVSVIVSLPPQRLRCPRLPVPGAARILVLACLLCSGYIMAAFGLRLSVPGLGHVYETRAAFRAEAAGAVGAGYIVPWAGNAINPLLMALGIARRRLDLVALALAGQVLIYSVTGFKSILFSVALVPLVYLIVAAARRSFGVVVTLGASVAVLAGMVGTSALTSPWPIALTTRTFAVPGQVTAYYFDYFSVHPTYELSHSVLRWLVPTGYVDDPPFVIGSTYFSHGTNANGSIWADAFANFGSSASSHCPSSWGRRSGSLTGSSPAATYGSPARCSRSPG